MSHGIMSAIKRVSHIEMLTVSLCVGNPEKSPEKRGLKRLNQRTAQHRSLNTKSLIYFSFLPHLTTVNIEPPVTDEVLLVEESSVRAEEAVLQETVSAVTGAHVVGLAPSNKLIYQTRYLSYQLTGVIQ